MYAVIRTGGKQYCVSPGEVVKIEKPAVEPNGAVEWPPLPSRAALAWRDLADGFGKSWMWAALALQDIKLRYRGSVLGPFWLTISTLVMVVAMGVIYGRLFHVDTANYLPYLALGLIVWGTFSSMITEGCETFLREQSVIQQVPIPFSIHAYRNVCRNFIVLAHNLVIVPIGLVVFAIPVNWYSLEVIPGFVLLAVNGFWISILLGLISARFRDVPPIVASFLQVLFFVTPIFWPVELLGDWQAIATLNPLFAAIDVVRAPLLGTATAANSWLVLLLMTVIGCGVTFAMFARFRTRIAYWI